MTAGPFYCACAIAAAQWENRLGEMTRFMLQICNEPAETAGSVIFPGLWLLAGHKPGREKERRVPFISFLLPFFSLEAPRSVLLIASLGKTREPRRA